MLYSPFLLVIALGIVSAEPRRRNRKSDPFHTRNSRGQQLPQWEVCRSELIQLQECQKDLLIRREGQQSERQGLNWQQPAGYSHSRQERFYQRPNDKSTQISDHEQNTQEETASSEVLESRPLGQITEYSGASVTFIASNKTAKTLKITDWSKRGQFRHIVELSPQFNSANYSVILGSKHTDESIQPSQGLVHTVLTAYKDHHNLVLTPDDIWTAIIIQLSRYVNTNAEEIRHRFVSHTGSKTLRFGMDFLGGSNGGGRSLSERDWKRAINYFNSELKKALNPRLARFVENNFTTTTDQTKIVSGLAFMSTMQQYFNYEFQVLCGIPRITILGTEGDWVDIANRVDILRQFGSVPAKWADILAPIINQFVTAKRERIYGEFWGDILRIQKNSVCGGGESEDVLNGWLTAFAVFDGEGTWRGDRLEDMDWPTINMKHVSSGVVTVPIKLITRDLAGYETNQDAIVFAGHMGYEVSKNAKTLTPYSGWAIATPNTSRPQLDKQFDFRGSGSRSARRRSNGGSIV